MKDVFFKASEMVVFGPNDRASLPDDCVEKLLARGKVEVIKSDIAAQEAKKVKK